MDICSSVCLPLSLTAGVGAQERPNLAGRWIPIGVSSQPEQPLVVTQTTTSLTVENTCQVARHQTGNLTVIIEVRRANGSRLLESSVYSR
jgi:hypothetical protein